MKIEDLEEEEEPAVERRRVPRHRRRVRDFEAACNSDNFEPIPHLRQDIRYVQCSRSASVIMQIW